LIELAKADLYSRNPFRVLGVGVDASRQDIERVQRRRAMQAELGMAGGSGQAGVFPVAPDQEADRAALEALGRPIDRFLYELFWFWPSGDEGEALRALERGDFDAAAALWQDAIGNDSVVARHNLAVLHQARALGAAAVPRKPGDEDRALQLWGVLIGERSFWRAVDERAEAISDRRVSSDLVEQVRATLPTAILVVHAERALRLARSGDRDAARAQVAILRGAGFDAGDEEAALQHTLAPLRAQLTGAIEYARTQWDATPEKGTVHVLELERVGLQVSGTIGILLPENDLIRRGIHDDLADALADGIIAYGNVSEDWSRAEELLGGIVGIAEGDAARARIERNRSMCSANAAEWNHWCAPGYWELPRTTIDELQAARESADAGDHAGAIDRLLEMDPAVGSPLYRALAFCLDKDAFRAYRDLEASGRRPDGLVAAAEHLTLADELDPDHALIRTHLSQVRAELDKLGRRMPRSEKLRQRLHGVRRRGTEVSELPPSEPSACLFCGVHEGVVSAAIQVPMCGDVKEVQYPLGSGLSYRYRTVVVPRCTDCRVEHEELPERVQAWRAAFALTGSEENFPDLTAELRYRTEDEEDASKTLDWADERLARASEAVKAAAAGPTSCERCGSSVEWDQGICRSCDRRLCHVGARDSWLAAGVAVAAFLNLFFGAGTSLIQSTAEALSGPGDPTTGAAGLLAAGVTGVLGLGTWLLFAGLSMRRRAEREEVREARRRARAAESDKRVAELRLQVAQAERAREEAAAALEHPRTRAQETRAKLEEAQRVGQSSYERECPWPRLGPGVSPESDYLAFDGIVRWRGQGWGFGKEPISGDKAVRPVPVDVVGLVS
jgi:hypothetical protein